LALSCSIIGNEKETASAGGGQATFEQSRNFMLNAVAGDNNIALFTGAVKNLDLLFGQKARGARL